MMPKRITIQGIFNKPKIDGSFNHFKIYKKYPNENDNIKMKEISSQNDDLLKPDSQIVLKRSSLIKYDDCIPFADGSDDIDRRLKESNEDKFEKIDKQSFVPIFKTGSISSLKISSLKEQWPSSEYVQNSRSKLRTQSTCDERRCPLPSNVINGTVCDSASFTVPRTVASISSQGDEPLSLSSDKTALASCLSKCDVRSKSVARGIMKLIDFTDLSLVESLQHFIRKIPVIGESQERDRILTYFTDRFMECNPAAFKDNDSCHTLVCALMLLNTDIHGQVSKKRMTCKEFVDNILTNYPDNDYRSTDLISVYNFIRKTELKNEESSDSTNTIRRKLSRLITKSIRAPHEINLVNIDPNLLNQQNFISGNIMRKCIKRSFGKKPALGHRGWKLQFASLIGLQLLLFKTNLNKSDGRDHQDECNGDRVSLTDSNISSELLQNDDSSLSISINNATKSINSKLPSSCSRENIQVSVDDVESCIKIHHSFASVVEKLRHKNVFSLRLADQAEYFFKVKSDQLHNWINNINYAAAVLSAPPVVGAGQCGLYKPLLPGYLTDFDKAKQIQSHEAEIRHYRESLKKLLLVNSKTRAINEPNIQFCKYEISRFEVYLRLLRSQSGDEWRGDQSTLEPDTSSVLSATEPPLSDTACDLSRSPRSAFNTYQKYVDACGQDMTTLRRRPPRVPNTAYSISRAASSSSSKMYDTAPLQLSPTTDSLHHFSVPQVYVLSARRPAPYSPQIGSHLPFSLSAGVRPTPSFSRFVDPCASAYLQGPQIESPLMTARSPLPCQQASTANKLPQYSPPSSRHNL